MSKQQPKVVKATGSGTGQKPSAPVKGMTNKVKQAPNLSSCKHMQLQGKVHNCSPRPYTTFRSLVGALLFTAAAASLNRYSFEPRAHNTTFAFTGLVVDWTVPPGINSINVAACGGKGGNGYYAGIDDGGMGGFVYISIAVQPGQKYQVVVGGSGSGTVGSTAATTGAWGSLGYGLTNNAIRSGTSGGAGTNGGGSGGGSTALLFDGKQLVVAGGGGGGGGGQTLGGKGGGVVGGNSVQDASYGAGGIGGSQTAPGRGGTFTGGGGDGTTAGGGGGGYYPGGGGSNYCGGGGGSSFACGITLGDTQGDARCDGNGELIIYEISIAGSATPDCDLAIPRCTLALVPTTSPTSTTPTVVPTPSPTPSPLTLHDGALLCDLFDSFSSSGRIKLADWCAGANNGTGTGTGSGSGSTSSSTSTPRLLLPCGTTPTSAPWSGVQCHVAVDGILRVTGVALGGLGLGGTIPSTIGGLAALTRLDLSGNNLMNSLPSALGMLTNLQFLGLSSNDFTGSVPSSLCNLPTSIQLTLFSNAGLSCYPGCLAFPHFTDFIKAESLATMCSGTAPSASPTVANISNIPMPDPSAASTNNPTLGLQPRHASTLSWLRNQPYFAYVATLILALVLSAAIVFTRRSAVNEYNIVELSAVDIVTSVAVAVMQVASNCLLLIVDSTSVDAPSLACLSLTRLVSFGVGAYLMHAALFRRWLQEHAVGATLHKPTLWLLLSLTSLCEPSILRFLPWKSSEFVRRSGGFPSMSVFKLTMFTALLQSTAMTALSAWRFLSTLQGQLSFAISLASFAKAAITIMFRLQAEQIHKIVITISDGHASGVVVTDRGVYDENSRRIQDQDKALEATHNELLRQKQQTETFEQELQKEREERARLAATIALSAGLKTGKAFDTNLRFAEETVDVLKRQVRVAGNHPLEYIPLAELNAELAVLMALVNAGEKYDERRLDHLLACLDVNPDYVREKEEEQKAWVARVEPYIFECLQEMRAFVPPWVSQASLDRLQSSGIAAGLAKRLLSKQCLWLLRLQASDICKLHEADLNGRYGFAGQNLDVVEVAALYGVMPVGGFTNDPSGKKNVYLSHLRDSLRGMMAELDRGTLSAAKRRNPVYKLAAPAFAERHSLFQLQGVTAAGQGQGGTGTGTRNSFASRCPRALDIKSFEMSLLAGGGTPASTFAEMRKTSSTGSTGSGGTADPRVQTSARADLSVVHLEDYIPNLYPPVGFEPS